MTHRRFACTSLAAGLAALLGLTRVAIAEPGFALHAEGAAAHMVGEGKAEEFGWGVAGVVAPELRLARQIGVEVAIGGVGLSEGADAPRGYAPTEEGSALVALPGIRLRPFAGGSSTGAVNAGGLWLAGGGGVAHTGGAMRPAAAARVGFDVRSSIIAAGPFVGMWQVVAPDDGVRPEDGRLALAGVHATLDGGRAPQQGDDDRDRDGIKNAADACPDDPEDRDGFQDRDGCPDDDNDRDGIVDPQDACPNDPEDKDEFKDADGCPEVDNDRDGILDVKDACPNDPEDLDKFQDEDGCSELDNDQDGFLDPQDACPNEPETENGYADEDGCPDEEKVRVVGDRIVLDDRVLFFVNNAEIRAQSWPILIKLATLLKEHPEYVLVHVQGHADDTGEEDYNQKLSEARARSVKSILVKFGVDDARLTVEAFGETKPREDAQTAWARRKNRRVEFIILARRGETVETGRPVPLAPLAKPGNEGGQP